MYVFFGDNLIYHWLVLTIKFWTLRYKSFHQKILLETNEQILPLYIVRDELNILFIAKPYDQDKVTYMKQNNFCCKNICANIILFGNKNVASLIIIFLAVTILLGNENLSFLLFTMKWVCFESKCKIPWKLNWVIVYTKHASASKIIATSVCISQIVDSSWII